VGKKFIIEDFFRKWNAEMSYVLGYIVADGSIIKRKNRKNQQFIVNITSVDRSHIVKIRNILRAKYKISEKKGSLNNIAYQLQISNSRMAEDLISLGVLPRKTYNLSPLKVGEKYFSDFVRGFFDGDGTVYIYKVNNVWQIKSSLVCYSFSFIEDLNKRICKCLGITLKSLHVK
jgi:intein-encoded DNA endonuclease-like protein